MYSEIELEQALHKAFVINKFHSIMVDSRRQRFQCSSIQYGIDKGWLSGEFKGSDEQSQAFVAELTEDGKKYFKL